VNSLLLTLTALLILVLSALFAAPLFIDWNDYRPVFETQAAKLLGRDVKVGGKVHLVLLPAPELRFDDVKVADQHGRLDQPFLQARSIEAWLNINALLTGTIEARKIAIVDPILRLDVNVDGTGNWSDVGRRGVALPFAPKDVLLDEVSVSGGRIEITKQGAPRLTLENINGSASAQSLSGPYKVSAAYDYDGRPQELKFSTSAPDADGLFRIKSSLRDIDGNTSYILDGGVSGLGATPIYEGTIVVRAANVAEANGEEPQADAVGDALRRDKTSLFELKGPLKATPDRAELPAFDLTVHAKGRPQIFKGRLAFDLGERVEASGALAAGFVDLDALFAGPGAAAKLSPADVLYMFAEEILNGAAAFGDGKLDIVVEQAGLGGDLLSAVELALARQSDVISIQRLKAVLPGDNRLEASGRLSRGEFGPVFAGPVKVEGSGLRPLTRWAGGNRDISGQASIGDFTVTANATIGDGALSLADVEGELSGTKFGGALRLQGGERRLIEVTLDSDRLDLREVIGERPLLGFWLPSFTNAGVHAAGEASLFDEFRDDDMRVTLRVGELLLPKIPGGSLDAKFALQGDQLDVEQLEFASANALTLTGKGRIERLTKAPSGRVDFALQAATPDSLRIVASLFGFPERVSGSEHLAALAPLDVRVSLTAAHEADATNAAIELTGKAGGSDVSLVARAIGDPAKLAEAKLDIDGSVTGEKPHALLVLLFPDLPVERLSTTGQSHGKLTIKLAGVPNTNVTGKAGLEMQAIGIAFSGQGSFQASGLAFTGKGALVSRDASLALMLGGFEAPPSAAGVPLQLLFDLVKQGPAIELKGLTGAIAGESVIGNARVDLAGDKPRFAITASAGSISLPSLLGMLVAWQRTPSTEELLGAVGTGASEFWPARGFSLGPIETSEGEITLNASTLSLGSTLKAQNATLTAAFSKDGLAVTGLKGGLFGGELAASGALSPRGNGAELEAHVELKAGRLEELTKAVAGTSLATGPFDLTFAVQGEGLSPPGLIAGLSGDGTLALGPGALQSLSSDPLRGVAATAAKKTIKADKDEIEAEANAVREKITKGTYKYAPVNFAFEIKNGTLRLAPTVLAGAGAETKVNGYVELASLKLDSEWALSLTGASASDVPPVNLLFTGTLNNAGAIAPTIDTAAIEAYLTMRRMQEDVERLETLDVTGRTQPPIEANEEPTSAMPEEPAEPIIEAPQEAVATATPEPEQPATETQAMNEPLPPPPSSSQPLPTAMQLLEQAEAEERRKAEKEERKRAAVMPAPSLSGTPAPAEPAPGGTSTEAVATPQAEAPPEVEVTPPPQPKVQKKRRQTPSARRREAPDDWRKGIPFLGGG
jgi:hypothetical protein